MDEATHGQDTKAIRFEDTSAHQWKVFVSSTSFGLLGFRDVARDVITKFEYAGVTCFEPDMMEDFGAQDGPAREVCARKVKDCDVLVGIIGIRYGAHPPDDQTSYTELEFQTAVDENRSRLMFLLDETVARQLEGVRQQGDDQADRQEQLRNHVGTDRVAEMTVGMRKAVGTEGTVGTEEDFRQKLTQALETWVREQSYKRALVDHSTEFQDARQRLLSLRERTGGAILIFGEPGTGKTTLVRALLNDVPLKRAYSRLLGPWTVRLAYGKDAIEQARAEVSSALDAFVAEQPGRSRVALPPVLIALFLESDIKTGQEVDPDTLSALPELFSWDVPRAVVLAETNNHSVRDRLARDLRWTRGAVITVSDYASVDDALEQIRRDAPDIEKWPEPDTRVLAEALGLRPISLFAAARDIEEEAQSSWRLVPGIIRQQLSAIASEESREGIYGALIRNNIEHLSPEARNLLALMTVLHPKPTLFPDEIAVALDLSLSPDDAIRLATTEEEEDTEDEDPDDADEQDPVARAYALVAELVRRGLLERLPRPGASRDESRTLLTIHPANVRVIHDYLPLTEDRRAEGHARAEAFYRVLVGEAVSGSFDSRFRMEKDAWWDDVEEWIYHLGHIARDQAGMAYATLFLDAYWWWDLYVSFDFCDQLLEYARRPRVRAVSPDMPEVTRLLTKFRETYPRELESARMETLAKMAGDDPARAAGLRETASTGVGIILILRKLCGRLGITELDTLFTSTTPMASATAPEASATAPEASATAPEASATAPAPEQEPAPDQTRLHLLGLICLFLAEGHRFAAYLSAEPGQADLAAAEACYRRAESYFRAEDDAWDTAWTRYLLGEVISLRGGDPAQVWEEAENGADEESDTELLAQVERARGDHLSDRGDLEGALRQYGRAVFYGAALQITSNLEAGADAYTQAMHREMRLHAVKILAEPLLHDPGSSLDDRVSEAKRRLEVMLREWGGHWKPEPGPLDLAFRSASLDAVEDSADAIAAAAFPPEPGDAVLGKPDSRYYREINDLIEKTRARPWVKGLGRWKDHRGQHKENS